MRRQGGGEGEVKRTAADQEGGNERWRRWSSTGKSLRRGSPQRDWGASLGHGRETCRDILMRCPQKSWAGGVQEEKDRKGKGKEKEKGRRRRKGTQEREGGKKTSQQKKKVTS